MDYRADHVAGILPQVLENLQACNEAAFATSYGSDKTTLAAKRAICTLFNTTPDDAAVAFVSTGTAANCLALACMAQPFSTILCSRGAHLQTSECNAPEFYTGAKLTLVDQHADGRLKLGALKELLEKPHKYPHEPKPSAVSITQPTEAGAVYLPSEIAAICALAKRHKIKVHMDGARIANALVKLRGQASLHEFTNKLGVDCISFGTTKNGECNDTQRERFDVGVVIGTMCCEAVVFFDKAVEAELGYRIKRAGQLVEKARFLSCQVLGYLKDDAWLQAAANANEVAAYFGREYDKIEGCSLVRPTVTNLVYVEMRSETFDLLVDKGYKFSLLAGSRDAKGTPSTSNHVRFRVCLSWRHTMSDVTTLLEHVKRASINAAASGSSA